MYARTTRAIRRIALSPVVICFALVVLAAQISNQDRATAAVDDQLIGRTVRTTLPAGDTIDLRFSTPEQVHWKVVAGPRAGAAGVDAVRIERIGPRQYFVNRVESLSGDTVAEVYDTEVKRVWSFRTPRDDAPEAQPVQDPVQTARVELIG